MSRPRQPLDAVRERRIVATAAEAFTRVGYELASLNLIISEAGWAKSSFYHYFPDKQRLHDHVVTTLRAAAGRRLVLPDVEHVDDDGYWRAVERALASLTEAVRDDPETRMLVRMFNHPLAARGPTGRLTLLRTDVRTWIAALLRRGQALGLVRRDLPLELLRDMAVGALSGALEGVIATPGSREVEPSRVASALRGLLQVQAAAIAE